MELSCSLPPSTNIVEQARLAESLGYRRLWVSDSPALYSDPWAALARVRRQYHEPGAGRRRALVLFLNDGLTILEDDHVVQMFHGDHGPHTGMGQMVKRPFELKDVAGRLRRRRVVYRRQPRP